MQPDPDPDAKRIARVIEYEHALETTRLLREAVDGVAKWRSRAIRHLHRIDAGELPEPAAPAPRRLVPTDG
jgi:hypothetical protein